MSSSTRPLQHGSSYRWLAGTLRELTIQWHFNRYDLSSAMFPGLIFALAAWHTPQATKSLLEVLLYGVFYFFLFSHIFCVSNQIAGLEEDRLNKPDRLLVVGAVSLRGAWVRWIIGMLLFALVGWLLDVLIWTLLWQIIVCLHNFMGWSKHWFTKNLSLSLGVIAQLAAAWQFVAPLSQEVWGWILFAALVTLSHASIQDLRDIAGDRTVGRRTLPIALGENFSRVFLAIAFALLPLLSYIVLLAPAGSGWHVLVCAGLTAAINLLIAVRVLFLRNLQADHRTYMFFTYWYCLTLASAIIML